MKFVYAEGATPFNQDDADKLIPQHITTQEQLNEWEQLNITMAERWLFSQNRKNIITLDFIVKLHKKMFDKTWKWAGKFRQHQTNIGVPAYEIITSIKILCDDTQFWIEHKTFSEKEIAVRFHHRLVQIHPFPNGNGRLSRMMADIILYQMKKQRLSWGRISLTDASITRGNYLKSLRQADKGNYSTLLEFADS